MHTAMVTQARLPNWRSVAKLESATTANPRQSIAVAMAIGRPMARVGGNGRRLGRLARSSRSRR